MESIKNENFCAARGNVFCSLAGKIIFFLRIPVIYTPDQTMKYAAAITESIARLSVSTAIKAGRDALSERYFSSGEEKWQIRFISLSRRRIIVTIMYGAALMNCRGE